MGCCVFEKNVSDLARAVFVDVEVLLVQVGHVLADAVSDRHVQRDEVDPGPETLLCPDRRGGRGSEHDSETETAGHLFPPVRVRARAVSPGPVTETAIFSGGIRVSGLA